MKGIPAMLTPLRTRLEAVVRPAVGSVVGPVVGSVFGSVVRPAQLQLRRIVSLAVDRHLRIVTTDETVAARLGLDLALYRRTWRALGWSGVARLVRRMDLGPTDVLLDLGCGAGRILCAVARQPIGGAIGVEFDARFAGLASENLARLRGRRCPATIEETDATTYEVPDEVTVVFLYNPFQGEILDRALDQVRASMERRPRTVRVVYANPVDGERLVEAGRLRPTGSMQLSWRPSETWARSQRVALFELLR